MLALWYTLEFVKMYIVAFYILSLTNEKSVKVLNAIIIIFLLMIDIGRFTYYGSITSHFYSPYIFAGLALFVLLYSTGSFKLFLHLLGIYVLIIFIDLILAGIAISIMPINMQGVIVNPIYSIILSTISILLLLGLRYIMKQLNIRPRVESLTGKETILIIAGVILAGFYFITSQRQGYESMAFSQLLTFIARFGSIVIIVVVIALVTKSNQVKTMKQMQMLQSRLISEQHAYYERLLKRDEKIRIFRHDIKTDFRIISHYIESNKKEKLRKYFSNLVNTFNELEGASRIDTGSEIVNIILHDLEIQYADLHVDITWEEGIPSKLKITDNDISSLFSNLLKNAFEALEKYDGERFVKVRASTAGVDFYVIVENSFTGEVLVENEELQTYKKDRFERGYGLKIIQQIVKRYDGQVIVSSKENVFRVELLFLDIIDE